MKIKVIVILAALIVASVSAEAVRRRFHRPQAPGPQYAPLDRRLEWYAQQARLSGKREVNIPAPNIDYAGSSASTDLEKALSVYSLVIAHPLEERSFGSDEGLAEIVTWYKFKIVETLVDHSSPACRGCDVPIPPKEFALNSDEFAAARFGGTVVIDGVTLTMNTSFPQLRLGANYLLFISKYPAGGAVIGAGPNGVFSIEPNGTLRALNKSPHSIKRDIEVKLGNSLVGLRAYALKRHTMQ